VVRESKGNLKEEKDGELARYGEDREWDGQRVSIAQTLRTANETDAQLEMDDEELNPYVTYVDVKGVDHIIFMLDAVTAYNQIMALKDYEPKGAALWFMGSEDPCLWTFFSKSRLGKKIAPGIYEVSNTRRR